MPPVTMRHAPHLKAAQHKPATCQRMLLTGGYGGMGGGDKPPDRWKPDDKSGSLIYLPRNKLKGGKHFIPANWIDRLLALAVSQSNLGQLVSMASDMQDLLGDEAPLELSFYRVTNVSKGPYVTFTNSSEKGLDQVFTNLRQRFRELPSDTFPNKVSSSEDGGGRRVDMPDNPSSDLALRLANAAESIINFFNTHIRDYDAEVEIYTEDGNQMLSWRQIRYLIYAAIREVKEKGKIDK